MKMQLRIGYAALLFVVAIALFVNCRSTKTIIDNEPELSVAVVEPADFEFSTISRNFIAKPDGFNITLNGQLRIKHDSIIWITLSKMVEIGRAKLTQDSIFVFLKIQNRYFAASYADLYKAIGVDINYQTVQALLLGNDTKILNLKNEMPTVCGDTIRYNLRYAQAGEPTIMQTIVLDAGNGKIVENRINIVHNALLQLRYSTFETLSDRQLATKIDVSVVAKVANANIGITFGKTLINEDVSFPYKVPAQAKPLQF